MGLAPVHGKGREPHQRDADEDDQQLPPAQAVARRQRARPVLAGEEPPAGARNRRLRVQPRRAVQVTAFDLACFAREYLSAAIPWLTFSGARSALLSQKQQHFTSRFRERA